MSRARRLVQNAAALVIVFGIAFFFYRAFRQNWASVTAYQFVPNYGALVGVVLSIGVASLLGTYGMQLSINALSTSGKLTFKQSVATFNSSGLTKYLPGKVWSYALQMYWLASIGIQKTLVLYVNLLNVALALILSTLTGLALLTLVLRGPELLLVLGAILAIAVADLLAIVFHSAVLRLGSALVLRVFKRNLEPVEFSPKLLLQLHLVHFAGAVLTSLGTYLTCVGIGYPLPQSMLPRVTAAPLLGDAVGFLALMVPGGLGVRESVMYFVLGGTASGSVSLILPVVSRTISMLLDLVLGAFAFLLLRRFNRPFTTPAPAPPE